MRLKSVNLMQIRLVVFVRRRIAGLVWYDTTVSGAPADCGLHLSGITTGKQATGIGGVVGNKGGVALAVSYLYSSCSRR